MEFRRCAGGKDLGFGKEHTSKIKSGAKLHDRLRRSFVGRRRRISKERTITMAQKLNKPDGLTRDTVADNARNELMKECLRKAEEIRRCLEGRAHSVSTKLIAEDRNAGGSPGISW